MPAITMTTTAEALTTYNYTVENVPQEQWADWIMTVWQALISRDETPLHGQPEWIIGVYNSKRKKASISLSDSQD